MAKLEAEFDIVIAPDGSTKIVLNQKRKDAKKPVCARGKPVKQTWGRVKG